MNAAALQRARRDRQRHVEGFGREARFQRRFGERFAPRGEGVGRLILQRIDLRAFGLARLGRHFAERRQQRRDRALLAQRGEAHGFELRLVRGCADLA